MPINISATMIKKLPESEQDTVEVISSLLWDKSGGLCFLCSSHLIEATDRIVADHDIPESENGPTEIANLNLTHQKCNSFKRSHPTVDVRPYLMILHKINKAGGFLKYDQAISLLGIEPKEVALEISANNVTITLPDGEVMVSPIHKETNKSGQFKFVFFDIPSTAIFNDDDCQPRTIKPQHLWQIYNDINHNPLHEQPTCRIVQNTNAVNSYALRMFDGQHKTLAFWIAGKNSVTMKIYLNLTKDAAVRLVNSIQSKIKKLPLSPFELSAKMAEEWQERVESYETDIGTDNCSEKGFIAWVDPDVRARAKSAFQDALVQSILDDQQLTLKDIVLQPGQKAGASFSITEAAFKNKLVKPLLHLAPLEDKFLASQKIRDRECATIVRLLNLIYMAIFDPGNGDPLSPQEEIRAKRFIYQSSLSFCAKQMRSVIGSITFAIETREFLDKDISETTWDQISKAVDRLFAHPIWTSDLKKSERTKAVELALSKNQNAERAFADVHLRPGYIAGLDKVQGDWLD